MTLHHMPQVLEIASGETHVVFSGVSCAIWLRINLEAINDATMQLKVASSWSSKPDVEIKQFNREIPQALSKRVLCVEIYSIGFCCTLL